LHETTQANDWNEHNPLGWVDSDGNFHSTDEPYNANEAFISSENGSIGTSGDNAGIPTSGVDESQQSSASWLGESSETVTQGNERQEVTLEGLPGELSGNTFTSSSDNVGIQQTQGEDAGERFRPPPEPPSQSQGISM